MAGICGVPSYHPLSCGGHFFFTNSKLEVKTYTITGGHEDHWSCLAIERGRSRIKIAGHLENKEKVLTSSSLSQDRELTDAEQGRPSLTMNVNPASE